jgi:16S rRNA (guanine966-N2)-methyltransferase
MRIISGSKKGVVIRPPSGLPIRPTTDFCKESLFNILENQFYFDQLIVLDLFAGSGAISYEFASRGAKDIVCVEKNTKCCAFIRSEKVKNSFSQIQLKQSDVLKYLQKTTKVFKLIFADPPYKYDEYDKLIQIVFDKEMLYPEGLLIIEHDEHRRFDEHPNFFEKRKYGQSVLSFFKQK